MSLNGIVPTVGMEVAVLERHSVSFGWHVTKVTPKSGQITIERKIKRAPGGEVVAGVEPEIVTITRKFNKYGSELGRDSWSKCYLATNVEELRERRRQDGHRTKAADALRALGNVNANFRWSKEDLLTALNAAQTLIDAGKAALEQLP